MLRFLSFPPPPLSLPLYAYGISWKVITFTISFLITQIFNIAKKKYMTEKVRTKKSIYSHKRKDPLTDKRFTKDSARLHRICRSRLYWTKRGGSLTNRSLIKTFSSTPSEFHKHENVLSIGHLPVSWTVQRYQSLQLKRKKKKTLKS